MTCGPVAGDLHEENVTAVVGEKYADPAVFLFTPFFDMLRPPNDLDG